MKTDNSRQEVADRGNEIFAEMRKAVESCLEAGDTTIDVPRVLKQCGIGLNEDDLDRMRIPSTLIAHPFLDWSHWWPWRELWGAWVAKEYPEHALFAPGGVAQDIRIRGNVFVPHEGVRDALVLRGAELVGADMK